MTNSLSEQFIPISYATALERHPREVGLIIEAIRHTRTRYRRDPPESFQWRYRSQEWPNMGRGWVTPDGVRRVPEGSSLPPRYHLIVAVLEVWRPVRPRAFTCWQPLEPLPPEVLPAWGRTYRARSGEFS